MILQKQRMMWSRWWNKILIIFWRKKTKKTWIWLFASNFKAGLKNLHFFALKISNMDFNFLKLKNKYKIQYNV